MCVVCNVKIPGLTLRTSHKYSSSMNTKGFTLILMQVFIFVIDPNLKY